MPTLRTPNKRRRSQARLTRKRLSMLVRMRRMKIWVVRTKPLKKRIQPMEMVRKLRPRTVIYPGKLSKRVKKMMKPWLKVTMTTKKRTMERLNQLLTKKKAKPAYRRMMRLSKMRRRLPPARLTKLKMRRQRQRMRMKERSRMLLLRLLKRMKKRTRQLMSRNLRLMKTRRLVKLRRPLQPKKMKKRLKRKPRAKTTMRARRQKPARTTRTIRLRAKTTPKSKKILQLTEKTDQCHDSPESKRLP